MKVPDSFYKIGILIPGIGGFLVLLGWIFQIEFLKRIISGFTSMRPITALCFILVSILIAFVHRGKNQELTKKEISATIVVIGILVTLAIATFWGGADGVFEFLSLINPSLRLSQEIPKMSYVTGACFLLLAGALSLRLHRSENRKLIVIADVLNIAGLVVTIVIGFSYLLGIDHFYNHSPNASVAIHTVLLFFCSFGVSLFLRPDEGFAKFMLSPLPGSVSARRLFPAILLTGMGLTWLRWKAQQYGFFGTEIGIAFSLTSFITCVSFVLWKTLNSLNANEVERNILQTERNRLYELPNHLLCILDEKSQFRSVNLGFKEVLGYESSELIGQPIWNFIHPEDQKLSVETNQKGRTSVVRAFENRYRAKDGQYKWLRWTGTILDGINYGAAIDVTSEKEKAEELRRAFTSMQQLSFRLHQAQEQERARISREIHDELGQSLAVLKMEMFAFKKNFAEGTPLNLGFQQMLQSIDSMIQSMRMVVAELRPAALEDLGLLDAVDWWLEGVKQRTGIDIVLQMDIFEDPMSLEQETAIFRVLQEAVTNSLRHSRSAKIEVQITERNGILNLQVRDFGQGIKNGDDNKITSSGILSMKERLRPFWGQVTITNAEGGGVRVLARMPLREGVRL